MLNCLLSDACLIDLLTSSIAGGSLKLNNIGKFTQLFRYSLVTDIIIAYHFIISNVFSSFLGAKIDI